MSLSKIALNGMMDSLDNFSARVQSGNVDLPENPSDVDQMSDEHQDVLCELVRGRYLKRLRETLVRNLRDTQRHLETTQLCQLEQCVDSCVAEMEKRALRQCMVASVYCRSMSHMINEVKTCSSDSVLHDSLQHIIVENVQPKDVENLSVSSARINYPEVNPDNKTPSQTESATDLLTNYIVNNFSCINGVPSDETLLRYFQDDGPNHGNQWPTSGKRPDNDSFGRLFANDGLSTTDRGTGALDELNLQEASSYILTAALPESDIFDDFNAVLKSSFGFPCSASEADVTHDSTEFLAVDDLPSFNTFMRYIQGSPEHGNEFSKLEDYLNYMEIHELEKSTPEPTAPSIQINNEVVTCMNDLPECFVESNNEPSLHDENVRLETFEKRSVLLSVDSEEDPDNTTPALMESANDPLSDLIANGFSDINGVLRHETLPRYLRDNPNQEQRLLMSEQHPDNKASGHVLFVNNDVSTTSSVTDVPDESNSPVASSHILSVSFEPYTFDDLNSVLKSSSGFPESASDARPVEKNVTRDPAEISAKSFDAFSKYAQGIPAFGNEFSKLEESFEPGVKGNGSKEMATIEPTTSLHDTNQNDVIRMSKVDEILKNEWRSARVAKTLELRKHTGQLPQAMLTRLEERYSDLFGDDHDYEPDPLTETEERVVCHRRVVNMVVGFMNPYYAARRINKRLFKDLAKIITKKLIDRSFDPDKETAERMVKTCFMTNRPIESAEDLYLITTQI